LTAFQRDFTDLKVQMDVVERENYTLQEMNQDY